MPRLLCVIIDKSAVCDHAVQALRGNLSVSELEKIEIVSFEDLEEKYPYLMDEIDGFPQFFLLDDEDNVIEKMLGADPLTLRKVIEIVKERI